MSNRLSGIAPLGYQGTNANQPPNIKRYNRAPTVNDTQNVSVGDFWIHEKSRTSNNSDLYVLMGLAGGIADWDLLSSSNGAVTQFTTDDATIVIPANGNVNLSGTHGLNTSGSGDTATFAIDNAITLGDLAVLSTAALTITSGNINMTGTGVGAGGNINIPNTNAGGTQGVITLNTNRFISNYQNTTAVGINSSNFTHTGLFGSAFGNGVLANLTTGTGNSGFGNGALQGVTTGSNNSCFGFVAGIAIVDGNGNCAYGDGSLQNLTSGDNNCSYGYNSLGNVVSGDYNIAVGLDAGSTYAGSESSNIAIGHAGVLGESNTIRIGTLGSGASQQNKCYIAACYSNYGTQNTFVGSSAGNITTTGTGANVAVGVNALSGVTDGYQNVVVGIGAATAITSGFQNTLVGYLATSSPTGDNNICIGQSAGGSLTTNDSQNILIGNTGTSGDNLTIRIGNNLLGYQQCFIEGIRGITTAVNDAIPVLIDSMGQLGTVSSSARYKENIEDMASSSNDLMKLRPVTFSYKNDESKSKRYGLVAEEVAEVFPDLAVFNNDGSVETVKYHEMAPILLNELQKLSRRVQELESKICNHGRS